MKDVCFNNVKEQLIIKIIKENLHTHYKQENIFNLDKELLYEALLREGLIDISKKKFFKMVAYGTLAVMGSNATLNFALSHMGSHSPVYTAGTTSTAEDVTNAILGGASDRTDAVQMLNDTDIESGAVKTKAWTSLESLAISGDEQEKVWNEVKNHPILRAIFIGNVFINSGSNFSIPDHAKIEFTDDEDLINKLSALGEFDINWKPKALELAKKQKTYKNKKIYLSFNNAWCGGYAAFMLRPGHGIPKDAVKKMSSSESYGNYMSKNVSKNMFIHNNKKPLNIDSQQIRNKIVPGAILQIGKSSRGLWAGHFITITGVGLKNGKVVLYTIEGNTAPESVTQAVSLGIQELYDNFYGLEKSNATGKIADAFARVAGGNASGSGRAVSGKARTLDSLQGQVFSITLPKYSQEILDYSITALKGMQSQGKKLSKKEKLKTSKKRKTAKASRKANRKKQNSSYELEGNVLLETYIAEVLKDCF